MKQIAALLLLLALPSMACNLSAEPPPTVAPLIPVLTIPVIGLNPVSGAPGTVVSIGMAGFTTGAKVNLYAFADGIVPAIIAKDLVISTGGILNFALTVPGQIGTTALTRTTPVTFTVETADKSARASAVYIVTIGTALTTVTPSSTITTSTGSTTTQTLYITGPNIGSIQAGTVVTVTGSGSAYNNQVIVQVLDTNLQLLGAATGTIQAAANTVGPWQVAVAFAQPPQQQAGYIVAYTTNTRGQAAQQSSIPIVLAGAGVPTVAPAATPTTAPTVPPVFGPTFTPVLSQ